MTPDSCCFYLFDNEDEDNTDFFPVRQDVLSTIKNFKLGSKITPDKTKFAICFIIKKMLRRSMSNLEVITEC